MNATQVQFDAPKRVLLIKPSALGDVVTAIPVLRGLRRALPEAHISWLLSDTCAPLVRHDSQLDEVVLFERRRLGRAWRSLSSATATLRFLRHLRAEKFDWVIDLQGLLRSGLFAAATRAPMRAGFADARECAKLFYNHSIETDQLHTVDRNIAVARELGLDARPEDMYLECTPTGQAFAETFLRAHGLNKGQFVICAPSTTWATKRYPARHWQVVVKALSKHIAVAIIAPPSDRELCRRISESAGSNVFDLSGQTAVDEAVGLVEASGGVICSDSAVKFIAPAVSVDCVTLIGPTRIERTGPYLRGQAIVADIPCQGCLKRRCSHITCMQLIDPADVISAAETMLNGQAS